MSGDLQQAMGLLKPRTPARADPTLEPSKAFSVKQLHVMQRAKQLRVGFISDSDGSDTSW
jgi:hypothetical protein